MRGTRVGHRGDIRLVGIAALLTAGTAGTTYGHAGDIAPFVVAGAALAALAALVGRSVEQLAERLGSGATGVVQSALGNLPELFVGIFALRAHLVRVVQAALVGSILANLLLVLGIAFVVGGLRHGTQHFGAEGPRTSVLLLLLAVAVVAVPTLSSHLGVDAFRHEQALSDVASVVLLAVLALSLPSSLRHSDPPERSGALGAGHGGADGARAGADVAVGGGEGRPEHGGRVAPAGTPWSALAMLAGSSAAAAFVSDWFVNALTPALGVLHVSQAFAGLVVVAIAGNAVENVVGIGLAARDRPDYSLSVILQSPVQIALGLLPALVLLSGPIGGGHLTLVLPVMLVVALAIGTLVAVVVVFDGESTWLEGAALVGLYVTIAAAFWWG
ncbi:MAG: calcium:cation antiporter [Acidimicrobiales bacterium]